MAKKSKKPRQKGTFEGEEVQKGALSVEEFLSWSGIGRNLFYKEVERKRIRARKCGTRTMVPIEEAERWLRELPEAGKAAPPEHSESDAD